MTKKITPLFQVDEASVETPKPAEALPQAIRLTFPDSYYDDEGAYHSYPKDVVFRNPQTIKHLIDRKSRYEVVED